MEIKTMTKRIKERLVVDDTTGRIYILSSARYLAAQLRDAIGLCPRYVNPDDISGRPLTDGEIKASYRSR